MSVHKKIQTVRVKLQDMNLKKSGQNKYAGYNYFELADFLPALNELMLKEGLGYSIDFNSESARLMIIDSEDETQKVSFESPMASASLKGCHDVQNLGAVQTYIKRYLFTNAFGIVEADPLDATTGKEDVTKERDKKATKKDIDMFVEAYTSKGISHKEMQEKLKGKTLKNISYLDLMKFYKLIEEDNK